MLEWRALPPKGKRIVIEWVEDIRQNPRYQDRSVSEELAPGVYRHIAKGGVFNDTHGRAGHGITLADVSGCRSDLRRAGVLVDEVALDVLLQRIVMGDVTLEGAPRQAEDPERVRSRVALARERARAEGRCIICLRNPTDGKATCVACGQRANAHRKMVADDKARVHAAALVAIAKASKPKRRRGAPVASSFASATAANAT